MRSVLVVGATGLIGGNLIRTLLRLPDPPAVYALARRPLSIAEGRLHPVIVDFERLAEAELPRAEVVFCSLGTTIRKAGSKAAFRRVDYGFPIEIAQRMASNGAAQFCLVSSVGADSSSPNFYLRVKAELERDLSSLPYRAVHVFRPSFLTGARAEDRRAERIGIAVAEALAFALVGSLRKYRAIPAETVAQAMAAAASKAAPGRHVYHYDEMLALAGGISGA